MRSDAQWMDQAIALARRGLGRAWPNPSVGCVLVKDGVLIGHGWTQKGGRPHAETEALARARDSGHGGKLMGATAYVSLEPCNHHGGTPPCTEALIGAGVGRVVAAIEDPDPRVSGQGLARLRQAGIAVAVGVGAEQAGQVTAGFLSRVKSGRPLLSLKLATSLDGRIATAGGESRWITGEPARAHGHALRADHDAVMIGIGTALADDPMLDVRLPGLAAAKPVRVVVDGKARLPAQSRLAQSARQQPVWLVIGAQADAAAVKKLSALGVEIVEVPSDETSRPDTSAMMQALGKRGLTRVLAEGGGLLAAALARADLVDWLYWYRAPMLLGGDAKPAIGALALNRLAESPKFQRAALQILGADTLETLRRRA